MKTILRRHELQQQAMASTVADSFSKSTIALNQTYHADRLHMTNSTKFDPLQTRSGTVSSNMLTWAKGRKMNNILKHFAGSESLQASTQDKPRPRNQTLMNSFMETSMNQWQVSRAEKMKSAEEFRAKNLASMEKLRLKNSNIIA